MIFKAICCIILLFAETLSFVDCYKPIYNGRIAGNRSFSECITGGTVSESDEDLTTAEMIRKEGYPVEEHVVLTEDGYLLTVHRIPGGANTRPVFLQHGILTSSFDWVLLGRGKALAFILADQGYDVWLGNARGNLYSQCHIEYDVDTSEYWDFSFHEIGVYDLPAVITYITDLTNRKLLYIGHSLGTTDSFIMASERPDIASKVKVIFSLGPVVYRTHEISLTKITDYFLPLMEIFIKTNGYIGIYSKHFVKQIVKHFCSESRIQRLLCAEFMYPFVGYDRQLFNDTYFPMMGYHYLSGNSLKSFVHITQVRVNDRFQRYDYGPEENVKRYGSNEPPAYDISRIEVPVALFWSSNDYFTHPIDVKRFSDQLPNLILNYKIEYEYFNHLDFLCVEEAYRYVYLKLLAIMEKYRTG